MNNYKLFLLIILNLSVFSYGYASVIYCPQPSSVVCKNHECKVIGKYKQYWKVFMVQSYDIDNQHKTFNGAMIFDQYAGRMGCDYLVNGAAEIGLVSKTKLQADTQDQNAWSGIVCPSPDPILCPMQTKNNAF